MSVYKSKSQEVESFSKALDIIRLSQDEGVKSAMREMIINSKEFLDPIQDYTQYLCLGIVGKHELSLKVIPHLLRKQYYTELVPSVSYHKSLFEIGSDEYMILIREEPLVNPSLCRWSHAIFVIFDPYEDSDIKNASESVVTIETAHPNSKVIPIAANFSDRKSESDQKTSADQFKKYFKNPVKYLSDPSYIIAVVGQIIQSIINPSLILSTPSSKHHKKNTLISTPKANLPPHFSHPGFNMEKHGIEGLLTKFNCKDTVHEGIVLKLGGNSKKPWRKVLLVLHADGILSFCPPGKNPKEIDKSSSMDLRYSTVKAPNLIVKDQKASSKINIPPKHLNVEDSNNHQTTDSLFHSNDGFNSSTQADTAFTIVCSNGKNFTFDAISVDKKNEWVKLIESQILSFLRFSTSSPKSHLPKDTKDILGSLKAVIGNDICADCGSNSPTWASINLGVLICIECCGVHRNLSSRISKVRSLELDELSQSVVNYLTETGNNFANSIWEQNLVDKSKKITPKSSRSERESWITSKYVKKSFMKQVKLTDDLALKLSTAIIDSSIKECYKCVYQCLDDITTYKIKSLSGQTCLHIAFQNGKPEIVQFFIWNSDISLASSLYDNNGKTPLDLVVENQNRNSVDMISHYAPS